MHAEYVIKWRFFYKKIDTQWGEVQGGQKQIWLVEVWKID